VIRRRNRPWQAIDGRFRDGGADTCPESAIRGSAGSRPMPRCGISPPVR